MPVLLDSGTYGRRLFVPAAHLRGKETASSYTDARRTVQIGLINNMPDPALEQTERQIFTLLDAAAGDIVVNLKLYALPEVPREELGRKHLRRLRYRSTDDLWKSELDALIITGTEPRAPDLMQEPYWESLTQVFDWAEANTTSTIFSCLAVHAAVQHFDAITRHALDDKCFGVFEFDRTSNHQMVEGLPPQFVMPHSRWNEIREDDLRSAGYQVLFRSRGAGVDMFLKARKSLLLFFQGHPEYEAWTLVGEYRRDIGRFLKGERETYPTMPRGCFDEKCTLALDDFREHALVNRRSESLSNFPNEILVGKLVHPWHDAAVSIYSNWLSYLIEQKTYRDTPDRSHRGGSIRPAVA